MLSITVRDAWRNGKVERGLSGGQFGRWSQEVAEAEGVPFVDVTNISVVQTPTKKYGPYA